jgi:hypothetical protein
MSMALKISQAQADALGFDLPTAVMSFVEARRAHAGTVDQPAPSAHPLVEEIVLRHAGAYHVVDDRTPADRRYELARQVMMIAQERVNSILSPARQNLAILDIQVISHKPVEARSGAEAATLSAAEAALFRISEIQRHAAALAVEIDELAEPALATWLPHGWPAL